MIILSKCISLLLGGLAALSCGLLTTTTGHASYNSQFAKEANYAKHEKLDATRSFDRPVGWHQSIYATQTKHGVLRNVSLLFYAKKQRSHFNGYAQSWINVRTLKNGHVYAYNQKTIYGHYLVAYHELKAGQHATLTAGAHHVRVSYTKAHHLRFKTPHITVVAQLKNGEITFNHHPTTAKANRSFKGAVPKKGTRVQRLITDAKRYRGVPYRYAGRDAFGGLDCASFVDQVYLDVEHRDIGGMTGVQQKLGRHVAVAKAKPGDLLFWQISGQKYTYHVALAIGHGRLIEEAGQSVHVAKIATRRPQFAIHMH